jgi:hypothetical protein
MRQPWRCGGRLRRESSRADEGPLRLGRGGTTLREKRERVARRARKFAGAIKESAPMAGKFGRKDGWDCDLSGFIFRRSRDARDACYVHKYIPETRGDVRTTTGIVPKRN